jgi:hypothetical protein
MKSNLLLLILYLFASCDDDAPDRPTGFIRAEVDGVKREYYALPDTEDGSPWNWRTKTAIYINYLKARSESEYWSISIYFPDTTTIQNMELPYVIQGPNPDFTGKSPEFHTSIIDPAGAPYGKYIAGASTFNDDFTLTITYFQDDIIKGKFNGKSAVNFTNGEFAAKLVRFD